MGTTEFPHRIDLAPGSPLLRIRPPRGPTSPSYGNRPLHYVVHKNNRDKVRLPRPVMPLPVYRWLQRNTTAGFRPLVCVTVIEPYLAYPGTTDFVHYRLDYAMGFVDQADAALFRLSYL
jgi:hypothetical protein